MRAFGTSSPRSYFGPSFPHPVEAEAYILAEFGRGGVEYRVKRNDFKLNCPIPHEKGMDTGFHLETRKDGTRAHCWVCDWSGSWNKLAPLLGLSPFGKPSYAGTYTKKVALTDVFGSLASKFGTVFSLEEESTLPASLALWDSDWRGMSSSFLSSIPSYLWKHKVRNRNTHGRTEIVERILWPYYQMSSLVGYVGRRLDKIDDEKYHRAYWCKSSKVLFPFDTVRETNSDYVVLVEGEVDALNLLQSGVPALSTLGSTSWSSHKRDLLLHLGASRIYLMMDSDPAGRKATAKLKKELRSYFSSVKSIKLEEGTDPGDLDKDDLLWLKKNVFQPQS